MEQHYAREGITDRVMAALRNVHGPGVTITPSRRSTIFMGEA